MRGVRCGAHMEFGELGWGDVAFLGREIGLQRSCGSYGCFSSFAFFHGSCASALYNSSNESYLFADFRRWKFKSDPDRLFLLLAEEDVGLAPILTTAFECSQ